ncbi:molybdopterin-dependent oxidoreductase [Neobacillus sp. Marseille-QA0830]
MKKWFPHGKWPKYYVWLHHYSIVSFLGLMLSGLVLYIPFLHVRLIRYLSFFYDAHIFLGIVFFLSLFSPIVKKLPTVNRIRKVDWFLPIFFGPAIVLTGLALWKVNWFPSKLREAAFPWHRNLSYLLGIWFILHGFFKATVTPYPQTFVTKKVDSERRQFLRWGVSGLLIGAIAMTPFSKLFTTRGKVSTNSTPGIHVFPKYFTVTDNYPKVLSEKYRLMVDGLVTTKQSFTFEQLTSLPVTKQVKNFQCVTGWTVSDVEWEGIHIRELVSLVNPTSEAAFITFHSADGIYTESLTLKEAMESDVLLAYTMDGQSLLVEQGFPLRLVVPRMYGYKSIKWVNRVEFASTHIQGYWEQRGYPADATF